MSLPLYIDSDNALTASRGDVDDAFAILALLQSRLPIQAIASVFGNTSEELAFKSNAELASKHGYEGRLLHGAKHAQAKQSAATDFLVEQVDRIRIVALGPLTNIAAALQRKAAFQEKIAEVVIVGGNSVSSGRWPPVWPHEFNLTKDRWATATVFNADLPLTIVPLNIAKLLKCSPTKLGQLHDSLSSYLERHVNRWLWRSRLLKFSNSFALWDLVAALYVIDASLFKVVEVQASYNKRGWINFRAGSRPIRYVQSFEPEAGWNRFVSLF